jgi:hypothetical protein
VSDANGKTWRPRDGAFLLFVVLLAVIPYRDFFSSRVPVGRDLLFYFYPLKAHLAEAVRSGQVPWIDRYRWGGTPLVGAPGAAPFDPGNLLFLLLPLGPAMKTWTLIRLLTSVLGFAFFSRKLGLPAAAAAVAGLIWALGGVSISLAPFPGAFSALSILPWFAAFVLDARRSPTPWSLTRLAVSTALLLVASVPEFVFYGALSALALAFGRPPGERAASAFPSRRSLGALLLAALFGAGLAAPSLLPAFDAASRSARAPGGGMGLQAAAVNPLAPVRLRELALDGLVADWSRAGRAPGVPEYPYLPSITPGRVAWLFILLGLALGGAGRGRAAALAVLGLLLALGTATPVWGFAARTVPFFSSIRYPEKHAILAGFGLAILAALGLKAVAGLVGPRLLRVLLPLVAFAVLFDREEIARRLSPTEEGSVLTARPALLRSLPAASGDSPRPRLFHWDSYAPVPAFDTRSLSDSNRVAWRSLMPEYQSLFGVAGVFELDYDVSLPLEAFEWTRMLRQAVPAPGPLPARIVKAAGASAIVRSEITPEGRHVKLGTFEDPVPPWRFASRVVTAENGPQLFTRFLEEGADPGAAYADAPLPGLPVAPSAGRVVSVRDGADALDLGVEVQGPGEGLLMVYRLRWATEEAILDGRRATTEGVGFGFTGLRVPAGRHDVRLRPPTRWVKIGLVIAVLSALALGAVVAFDPARRRPGAGA